MPGPLQEASFSAHCATGLAAPCRGRDRAHALGAKAGAAGRMIGVVEHSESIEFGQVIAEREFAPFREDGTSLKIAIRLGKPFQEPATGEYRCPIQILGTGDEGIRAPWGEDPFVALQYAIDLVGQLLDDIVRREKLEIRFRPAYPSRTSWIWRYPPH